MPLFKFRPLVLCASLLPLLSACVSSEAPPAPASNPFAALSSMMALMRPIAVQSAVEHCPQHFDIADKASHSANLAKARATFTNPGDYHFNTIKARADKRYGAGPQQCDQDLKDFKQAGDRDLIYKK